MMNIDHIGIAVADLDSAIELYSKLLKRTTCRREVVESQQTEVAFFQAGESAIELLSSTAEDSPVGKFLKKRGEGVDRKSTRLNSSHVAISYAVFCLKKKITNQIHT